MEITVQQIIESIVVIGIFVGVFGVFLPRWHKNRSKALEESGEVVPARVERYTIKDEHETRVKYAVLTFTIDGQTHTVEESVDDYLNQNNFPIGSQVQLTVVPDKHWIHRVHRV